MNEPLLPKLHPMAGLVICLGLAAVLIESYRGDWIAYPSKSGNASEIITALATLVLVFCAFIQLREIRWNQQRWATLQACDRYDSDAVLNQNRRELRAFYNGVSTVPGYEIEAAAVGLLNYFDAIAIGIKQGLYLEAIVVSHLGNIMKRVIAEMRSQNHAVFKNILSTFRDDFSELSAFLEKNKLDT